MSNQPSYLKSVFEYYSNLSNDTVNLVGKLAQGTQGDTQKAQALNTEAVSLLTRGMLGLWAPLLVGNPWVVRRIQIDLAKGTTSGSHSISWPGAPDIALEWSVLKRVAGTGNDIEKDKLKVEFVQGSDTLRVTFTGLAADLAVENRYESVVTDANTGSQIAILVVVIGP